MATKNATIRIPEDIAEWLTEDGKSINQAVIENALNLRSIRKVSTGELKGVFTPDEWSFFADSLNGTMVTDVFRANVQAFIAHCEDSAKYDYLDKKWNIDMDDLKNKIANLKGANRDAIYTRVEDFWAKNLELEDWASSL